MESYNMELQKINLKLESFESFLDDIQCVEEIDMTIFNKILNSDLLQEKLNTRKCGASVYKSELEQLKKYRTLINKNNNKYYANVNYKKGDTYGRSNPLHGLGLYNIRRQVRHTLCRDKYIDIDIVNCHPNILYQVCKNNNIEVKYLEKYINNRDEYLKKVMEEYNVDRDQSKTLFLRMLLGGSPKNWAKDNNINKELIPFIYKFKNEIQSLMKKIEDNNPHIKKQSINNYKTYHEASTMSYFLQDIERRMLHIMVNYCIENKIIDKLDDKYDTVLCADGFMIKKNKVKLIDINLILKQMEDLIEEKLSIKIKLETKPMDQHFNDLDNHIISDLDYSDVNYQYKHMKKEFEKNHCKIINNSSFAKISTNNEVILMNKNQLITSYEHMKYEKVIYEKKLNKTIIKSKNFINDWIKDENISLYEDLGVYPPPLNCPSNIFNIWTPFPYEKYENIQEENDNINFLLDHIRKVVGEEFYDYFIHWVGHSLKYPAEKIGRIIYIISKQGAGKGTIMKIIEELVGHDKFLETTQPEENVWGKFNSLMTNSYMVYINEVNKKNEKDYEGRIKALVTDENINIQYKGKNSFKTKSYHRFIVSTNNIDPTELEEGDRRKVIIRCSDELIGNKEHFNKIYELLKNKSVMKCLYDYLINLNDLDKFKNVEPPISKYQKIIQQESKNPLLLFLEDYCIDKYKEHNKDVICVKAINFYEEYKNYNYQNGFVSNLSTRNIFKKIKLLIRDDLVSDSIHKKSGKHRKIKIKEMIEYFDIDMHFVD